MTLFKNDYHPMDIMYPRSFRESGWDKGMNDFERSLSVFARTNTIKNLKMNYKLDAIATPVIFISNSTAK